ncbi:hypothetical protein [Pyxidicoccus sp. MSG2]|uniref:hypothetical protein n=1 Tax=Pyxidicoccus sp. MSG2 TaxID=2996790 RepID=UPI002270FB36|nr:hypothetical protein [Pyxidicoccus sp. MSG2]MCY1014541.1 hypothetical protein [Pyxidicoccus sp. MSG2]
MPAMKSAVCVVGLLVAVSGLWPATASAACGCSNMRLVHAGATGTMCSNAALNFLATECAVAPGASKGCATTWAYECNLGVNSKKYANVKPYQRTGFQPVATLTAGSTVSQCSTGQLLQLTITGNGSVEANPAINPTSLAGTQTVGGRRLYIDNSGAHPFPQVGATQPSAGGDPKFGGDNYSNYTSGDVLFNYNAATRQLSWWDNTDQSKDAQGEVATWKYKFVSFVQGTAGQTSCACAFDIAVNWPANNNAPVTTWTYQAGGSQNCTW